METRKLRKVGPEMTATRFEAVIVEDEFKDESLLNENTPMAKARSGNNKKYSYKIKKQPKQKGRKHKNRAIQVCSEDIDASMLEDSRVSVCAGEDEPLVDLKSELCPNLCRFCLRQASPENLKPIDATYKAKALACFRVRIFNRDSFKMACSNCLNLLDMLIDFKDAVTKAKKLLAIQKGHMESEEWDTSENVDAFNKCKTVVEEHRQQIDSLYDEYVRIPKEQLNTICTEPRRKRAVKSEPEQSSAFSNEATKIESSPDIPIDVPSKAESSSFPLQDTAVSDENNGFDERDDSDNDFNDEEDEDYDPNKKTEKNSGSGPQDDEENDEDNDEEDEDFDPKKKTKKKPETPVEGTDSYKKLCDICGEKLYSSTIESHRNQHLGIKPYTCPAEGCGFTFHSSYNLKAHTRRHHGSFDPNESHVCNICGKVIRGRLFALKAHQRTHTTEKNHVCQVCGKGFTMKCYLTQHSIVHSGEMPHKCSYCGKRFNNKWSMKTHEKNIHEKNNQALSENWN